MFEKNDDIDFILWLINIYIDIRIILIELIFILNNINESNDVWYL